MRPLPKPGDVGMASWRGLLPFRARVNLIVTGKNGPALVVEAIDAAVWHALPASSVVVDAQDFVPEGATTHG
ncbi:MAG: hypothetical protein WBL29_05575 [Burkholderiales bacterium]